MIFIYDVLRRYEFSAFFSLSYSITDWQATENYSDTRTLALRDRASVVLSYFKPDHYASSRYKTAEHFTFAEIHWTIASKQVRTGSVKRLRTSRQLPTHHFGRLVDQQLPPILGYA